MAEISQPGKSAVSEFPFAVTVGQIYDGPLDLLLDLVRKQDIDIYDIPIAKITAQYLGYVENLKQLDVDVAADSSTWPPCSFTSSQRCFCRMIPTLLRKCKRTRAMSWLSACLNTRNSKARRRCFCRSSRLKKLSGAIPH